MVTAMERINYEDVERHYKLLGHEGLGVTEMDVIFPSGKIYTQYVGDLDDFVRFCKRFSSVGNVYAGINPRPGRLGGRRRARDGDIEVVQHILFDIEVGHGPGTDLPWEEVERSKKYAELLSAYFEQRGFRAPAMSMSGNGWHVLPCLCATKVEKQTKEQVRMFFEEVREFFGRATRHERAVKLDSTYDLSRLAMVSGTLSMKGRDRSLWRLSRADPQLDRKGWLVPDEALTSYILRLHVEDRKPAVRRDHRKRVEVGPDLMEKIKKDRGLRGIRT